LDWWDGFIETNLGIPVAARAIYNEFLLTNDLDKKEYSQKRFKKAIQDCCDKFGYTLAESRQGTEKILHYVISR
jgi:hypothetical protein